MTEGTSSELVKLVFPFDSPFTILLLVIIVAILVFYALLLIKLKPARGEIETTENEVLEPRNIEKPIAQTETIGNASKEITPTVQELPAETIEVETGAESVEVEETKKNDKDKDLKRAFFLFGEKEFEGCPHKFGYLKSLRKNAPIPDECFGCPQILECLMTRKSK
jgi:hypothetical protein